MFKNVSRLRDFEQREPSRVAFQTRSKTADALRIYITTSPAFPTLDQNRSELPNPRHTTVPQTTKQLSRTTYSHSPPDPYLVEEESLYLFWHTDFYLSKNKRNSSLPLSLATICLSITYIKYSYLMPCYALYSQQKDNTPLKKVGLSWVWN